MERVQILLDSEQKRMLNKIAKQEKQNFSELVRNMLEEQIEQHQKAQLAKAARALLADYEKDEELTAFTALDGDDFHA
jgi:metal-responsive CopG/Arc/MetJ family transcriptional regulator